MVINKVLCKTFKIFTIFFISQIHYVLADKNEENAEEFLKKSGFIFVEGKSFIFGGYKNEKSKIVSIHSFWACNHKITVGEYNKCIEYYINDKDMFKFLIPQNEIYVNSQFFKDPGHFNDPVRFVSLNQIEKYCEWLTKTNNKKIVYNIINETQWECIASEAINFYDNKGKLKIQQKKTLEEIIGHEKQCDILKFFNVSEKSEQKNDDLRISSYKKYPPNNNGFYDIFGNCREVTSSLFNGNKNFCVGKGAYYGDPYKNIKIENAFEVPINKGSFEYGFRIVANIKII